MALLCSRSPRKRRTTAPTARRWCSRLLGKNPSPSSMPFNTIRATSSDWRLSYSVVTKMTMSWALWIKSTAFAKCWASWHHSQEEPWQHGWCHENDAPASRQQLTTYNAGQHKDSAEVKTFMGATSELASSRLRSRCRCRGSAAYFRWWRWSRLRGKQRGQEVMSSQEWGLRSRLSVQCSKIRGCKPICRNVVRDTHVECIDIEN